MRLEAIRSSTSKLRPGLALWALTLLSPLVVAQEEPGVPAPRITVEVVDAYVPESLAQNLPSDGGWLPLYLELRSTEANVETVTVSATTVRRTDRGEENVVGIHEARVEVPPGRAPRRTWLYVPVSPEDFAFEFVRFRLIVRGESIPLGRVGTGGTLTISQRGDFEVTCLVVGGDDEEVSPWGRQLEIEPKKSATSPVVTSAGVSRWKLEQLPDRVLGYDAVRLIVLRGGDLSRLEESQRRALVDWIQLGGRVVLAPTGRDGSIFQSDVARELLGGSALEEPRREEPFRPENLFAIEREGAGLRGSRSQRAEVVPPFISSGDIELEAGQSLSRFEVCVPETRFTRVLRSSSAARVELPRDGSPASGHLLFGEVPHGAGRVGILAFDDQAYGLRDGFGELRRSVWRFILRSALAGRADPLHSVLTRRVRPDVFVSLADREREVGTWSVGALVVAYMLIIGPGVYLVLRRRDRLASIVWVVPLIVVSYLLVIFLVGYWTKGYLTKTRAVTIYHFREGDSFAIRESYLSVFSADNADYTVQAPGGEALVQLFANASESEGTTATSTRFPPNETGADAVGLALRGVHLDLWQQGVFLNLGIEPTPSVVTVEPLGGSSIRLTNRSGRRILGGRVVPIGSASVFDARHASVVPPLGDGERWIVDGSKPDPAEESVVDDEYTPIEERLAGLHASGSRAGEAPWLILRVEPEASRGHVRVLEGGEHDERVVVWCVYRKK